jgi:protein-disulfide isomerase
MITIEVLMTTLGCAKCEKAKKIIDTVMGKFKGNVQLHEIDIVKNPQKLIDYGVMSTPAVIINKKLICEGVPNEQQLCGAVEAAM